jgi:peptidoglycan/LPS O-acetylase OafA/YrhL
MAQKETVNSIIWPRRLYLLDISRGIASLSVVLWHWNHFAFEKHILSKDFILENQPLYNILKIFYEKGYTGVDYFYLLSGFIFFWLYKDSIKMKLTTARVFIMHRFSRLYPLHLVTLIIVALLQYLYTSRQGYSFIYPFNDLYHFLLQLGFASYWGFQKGWSFNGPIWSVSIEVILYFIFFLSAVYHLGNRLFCFIVSIVSVTLLYLTDQAIFEGLSLFFLGGFIYNSLVKTTNKDSSLKLLIYSFTIISWLFVFINFYVFDISNLFLKFGIIGLIILKLFPIYILFPLTVSSLVLFEIDKGSILKKLSWIGDITYSSYLLHFPLQLLFALAVSYSILDAKFYLQIKYLILFYVILIPLSYAVHQKFELPIQKIIRKFYS